MHSNLVVRMVFPRRRILKPSGRLSTLKAPFEGIRRSTSSDTCAAPRAPQMGKPRLWRCSGTRCGRVPPHQPSARGRAENVYSSRLDCRAELTAPIPARPRLVVVRRCAEHLLPLRAGPASGVAHRNPAPHDSAGLCREYPSPHRPHAPRQSRATHAMIGSSANRLRIATGMR